MLTYRDLVHAPDADVILESLMSGESVDEAEAVLWHARATSRMITPLGGLEPLGGDKVIFVRVAALDPKPSAMSCTLTVRGGLPGGVDIPCIIEDCPFMRVPCRRHKGPPHHARYAVGDCLALQHCCVRVEGGRGVALAVNAGVYDSTVYNFGRRAADAWPAPTAEAIGDLTAAWMVLGGVKEHSRTLQLCDAEIGKVVAAPRSAPQLLERLAMLFLKREQPEAALGYACAAWRLHGGKPGLRCAVVAAAAAAASGRFAAAKHMLEQSTKKHRIIEECLDWMRDNPGLCRSHKAQEIYGSQGALVSAAKTSLWLPHTFNRKYSTQAGHALALHGHGAVLGLMREGDAHWRRGDSAKALAAWRTALRVSNLGFRGSSFSLPRLLSVRATAWQQMESAAPPGCIKVSASPAEQLLVMRDEGLRDCLTEAFLPAEFDSRDQDVRERRSILLQAVRAWERAAKPVCAELLQHPVGRPRARPRVGTALEAALAHVSVL